MVAENKMPPKQPLAEEQRALLRRWIERGAPGLAASAAAAGSAHWAYRVPLRPAVPEAQHRELLRTPIDCFVEAALEKKGLSLGPEADRETLLRRASFDLVGVPPTPAEREAF